MYRTIQSVTGITRQLGTLGCRIGNLSYSLFFLHVKISPTLHLTQTLCFKWTHEAGVRFKIPKPKKREKEEESSDKQTQAEENRRRSENQKRNNTFMKLPDPPTKKNRKQSK